MHKHLLDWIRKIHLTADSEFAARRWKLAAAYEKKTSRRELLTLLRVFLFDPAPPELIQSLSDQFQEIDKEFPGIDNTEEIKLMAGIVMVVAFSQRNWNADAFALGIKAASFPLERCKTGHPHIILESTKYLEAEAEYLRPSDFGEFESTLAVATKLVAITAAEDDEKRMAAAQEVAGALHNNYGGKIQRLAEETGLLWWLLGGYSTALGLKMEEIEQARYALVAAVEVAGRTQLIPPPPSIYSILERAIANCKPTKSQSTLKSLVNLADAAWRKQFAAEHSTCDCAAFVPIVTAIVKAEENGDVDVMTKALPKFCPGVSADQKLSSSDAAAQLYDELMFLKALANLH